MRQTKQQLMNDIEKKLKMNPNLRVNVKDMQELRNGRWGLHAYEIGLDSTCKTIMVYPWSGNSPMWIFDANKLKMPQLQAINERINSEI